MTTHRPTFLRIYEDTTSSTAFSVQNYYHSTITVSGVAFQFLDFSVEGLQSTSTADQNQITVTLPALTTAIDVAARGTGSLLAEVTVYSFDSATAPESPPVGQVTLLQFVGLLAGWDLPNFDTTLAITIGSILSPIGAEFPPRRYSSVVVGIPCRL
jgi:hypothetical protein